MLEDPYYGRRCSNFTVQWHLTHACDLHCKHCYDRTNVSVLRLEDALALLDDMERFCDEHKVRPNMCLSGGNPFFYPWFFELYQSIVDRGMDVSILGNPIEEKELDRLIAIKKPQYFQVSLEGLKEHNDCIRGEGFFDKVQAFLPMLRERGIRSIVMTTLTNGNADQVIPLGHLLSGKADRYTYNRLAQVGEGANLGILSKEEYGNFMVDYAGARKEDPVFGIGDNLFNIFNHEMGLKLHRGCTGFGCGAAFNFVALLPNGEVHACRKLPSQIGSIRMQSLSQIYHSEIADRYRRGPTACEKCAIREKCGGCMAVAFGQGLDHLEERDPQCFMFD